MGVFFPTWLNRSALQMSEMSSVTCPQPSQSAQQQGQQRGLLHHIQQHNSTLMHIFALRCCECRALCKICCFPHQLLSFDLGKAELPPTWLPPITLLNHCHLEYISRPVGWATYLCMIHFSCLASEPKELIACKLVQASELAADDVIAICQLLHTTVTCHCCPHAAGNNLETDITWFASISQQQSGCAGTFHTTGTTFIMAIHQLRTIPHLPGNTPWPPYLWHARRALESSPGPAAGASHQ
jgi:hypothetical protein